jgi:glycosyltransferase involved in cell wall biosynthesis
MDVAAPGRSSAQKYNHASTPHAGKSRSAPDPMKLLVVCSSLDLAVPLSATPAWWQLLKGLYESGVDLVVTTYQGPAPDTPWWRAYPNPARLEGELYMRARALWRRVAPRQAGARPGAGGTRAQAGVRMLAQAVIAPKWRRHLSRLLARESGVDAVLLMNVPPNHVRGLAAHIRDRHRIPVLFYDGDLPASLPQSDGFATGFRIYDGADLGEFDAVVCNSEGSTESLAAMGARAVHTLHYAADAELYAPLDLPQDIDVFFYGHGAEYRAAWIRAMVAEPSGRLPQARFAVRGYALGDLGRAQTLRDVPFHGLRQYIARSRINLAITREGHARTYGTSTMRPFELAMMGACIVSNPYAGIERWFEPGPEIVIVGSAEEAVERYQYLLAHDAERRAIGQAARRRALAQHTYRHRAGELVGLLRAYVG